MPIYCFAIIVVRLRVLFKKRRTRQKTCSYWSISLISLLMQSSMLYRSDFTFADAVETENGTGPLTTNIKMYFKTAYQTYARR